MNATSDTAPSRKRHGWLFKLGIVAGVLVVLIVILYFVATSGAFIKGVILPRVGKAAHADIAVSELSVSPWSEVEIKGLKVTPEGKEPLLEAQLVRARYSLWDILHGKIVVSEVTLDSPVVNFVKKADGTSNLDPLLQKKSGEAKPASTAASKPAQLDIRNVNLKNAQVNMALAGTNGGYQNLRISGFNLGVDKVQNAQPIGIKIDAAVALDKKDDSNAVPASMEARLGGAFDVRLSSALSPEGAAGKLRVDVGKAGGSMVALKDLGVALDCDWTPAEVRKLALHLEQSGATLADLNVSGPYSTTTGEGKLKVALSGVDRKALALVGTNLGIDFNKTTVNSTNEIELRKKGTEIAVNGQFNLVDFSATLAAKAQTTPTLCLGAIYQVTVDQTAKSALIQKLDINGTANQNNFLKAGLSKPMPISWGAGSSTPDEAALDLTITSFNLADWQAFAAEYAPAGTLDSSIRVISKDGGARLDLDVAAQLRDFSAQVKSNHYDHVGLDLSVKGQVSKTGTNTSLNSIALGEYGLKVSVQNKPALAVKGSGSIDTVAKAMDLKTTAEVQMPTLLALSPVPDLSLSSGVITVDSHVAALAADKPMDVDLAVLATNLTGHYGSNDIAKAGIDLGLKAQLSKTGTNASYNGIALGNFTLKAAMEGQPLLSIKSSGTYDADSKAADLKALVEAGVIPPLAPLLTRAMGPRAAVSSGALALDGHVIQSAEGKQLDVDLTTKVSDLSARFESNSVSSAGIDFGVKAQISKTGTNGSISRIVLSEYHLAVSQRGEAAVNATGSGDIAPSANSVNVKAALSVEIAKLLQIVHVPGIDLTSGTFKFDGQVAQSTGGQTVSGTVALTALTGTLQAYKLDRLETQLDTDIQMSNNVAQIRKLGGTLSHAGKAGGGIAVNGSYDTTKKTGQFTVKASDVNQNLLQPFVNPALNGKKLASVSINLDTTASVDLAAASTFKGTLGVTNLLVKADSDTNSKPLSVGLAFDTTLKGTSNADLRQFQITLTPTSRATNQVNITGLADWGNPKAFAGDLKVQAESIDVTPYMEMLSSGQTNSTATASTSNVASSAPATASTEEPDAVNLPFGKLNVAMNVGRFYLKQIEITNWLATTKIEGSHIVVDPFQLSLNGAPVKSSVDANLGVKGYQYQLVLKMDKVSLDPIILSFAPAQAGKFQGFLITDVSIKGAGVKDPDLAKNLSGQIGFSLTNGVVQITNSSWFSSLLSPVFSTLGTIIGTTNLATAPLNSISCRMTTGDNKATLETFNFKSAVFIGDVHGDIAFANPLTSTPLNLPMTFSIRKEFVQNVPFFSGMTSTNSDYVEMPLDAVKVSGTLGAPKASMNLKPTMKNVTTILKGVENQVGGKDGKAILGGINSVIGGSQSTTTATNNAISVTNAVSGAGKLLNLFNRGK
jgi:uncharacterized protein involved in outer membrane biogenesis